MSDVNIKSVDTLIEITEPVGPLSAEDVKRLVGLVLQALGERHGAQEGRMRDTKIRASSFQQGEAD